MQRKLSAFEYDLIKFDLCIHKQYVKNIYSDTHCMAKKIFGVIRLMLLFTEAYFYYIFYYFLLWSWWK